MGKRLRTAIIFLLIPLFAFVVFVVAALKASPLSEAQKTTVDLLGNPEQFVITYLPRGDDEKTEMVRSELWFYPSIGKAVHFLAGEAIDTEEIEEGTIEATKLLPWDFDPEMTAEEVNELLGETVQRINDLPGFDEEIETYSSNQALFILEQGYLTYFQTLISGNEVEWPAEVLPSETIVPTAIPAPEWQTHTDSLLGFQMQYPAGWDFPDEDIVLTNYQVTTLTENMEILETAVKCDLVLESGLDANLSGEETVWENQELTITKTKVIEAPTDEMGYGDGVVYFTDSQEKERLAFICYLFDEAARPTFEEMLKTIKYLE